MISRQYQCLNCKAVLEAAVSKSNKFDLACLSCSSVELVLLDETLFYANKNFCPHDKKLDPTLLKDKLGKIVADTSLECGGCGVDGPAGSCGTKKSGCGSGNCSCGKKGQSNKLKLDLYSNDLFVR
jgi:hypothetical protein